MNLWLDKSISGQIEFESRSSYDLFIIQNGFFFKERSGCSEKMDLFVDTLTIVGILQIIIHSFHFLLSAFSVPN